MSDQVRLVNLGELSKPATVLIEKVSEAIGGVFKPHQIIRVAKADAEVIRAEAQIHVPTCIVVPSTDSLKKRPRRANSHGTFAKRTVNVLSSLEEQTQNCSPRCTVIAG